MDIKDCITIFSVLAVILGWFINGYLNRRHELFKRKIELRFNMYNSFFSVAKTLEKIIQYKNPSKEIIDSLSAEFINNLEICQLQILLYGTQSEINLINEIVSLAEKNKHVEMKNIMKELTHLTSQNLRKDLGLKKVKIQEDL